MAWFKDWFDTPYYHVLYGERDEKEAGLFIQQLLHYLSPNPDSVFLDLACGKGRHSKDIASHGYKVFGVDLSSESIKQASKGNSVNPHFEVHDMRKSYKAAYFDFILNLFTSFGYFKNSGDDLKTLAAVHNDLKPGGIFVQDYFNTNKIVKKMKSVEHKVQGGIDFEIRKTVNEKCVIKDIRFRDKGCSFHFEEKVSLFDLNDFKEMYRLSGLTLMKTFGSYQMDDYDSENSDRLILISKKQ